MHIDSIYLGTWLPRTGLHLQEAHAFLRRVEHNDPELKTLHDAISPHDIALNESIPLHELTFESEGREITITEDGVILLENKQTEPLDVARAHLEDIFTHKIAPLFKRLFGRGAPLPKALKHGKDIYPFYACVRDANEADIDALFASCGERRQSKVQMGNLNLWSGMNMAILEQRGELSPEMPLREVVLLLIFFREFASQLDLYLNQHRDIWDEMSRVREAKQIRYRDFKNIRSVILQHRKTLAFVEARLEQMEDILDEIDQTLPLALRTMMGQNGMDRIPHLRAQKRYIKNLWKMTQEYVDSTENLLESLFQENTQREFRALRLITIIGVIAGFFGMNIGFPWEERWPDTLIWSYGVVALMAVVALGLGEVINRMISFRTFSVVIPRAARTSEQ